MAGDSVSYLADVFTKECNEIALYTDMKIKLNSNGLLNTYEEVEEFIKERKKLLEQGMNFEDYWEAVPVRLSLVEI